jgi:putative addiction module component (TIGR02574 family)
MNTIDSIESKVLQLKPHARAKLVHSLVHSLDNLPESELEALWLAEAERRDAEMESGAVEGIPGDEVFERIRSRYSS